MTRIDLIKQRIEADKKELKNIIGRDFASRDKMRKINEEIEFLTKAKERRII